MRKPLLGWLLLLTAVGCHQPLRVDTRSEIAVVGPVDTTARVSTDSTPILDHGPVRPMVVQGPADCQASRIAILDVDGLLLNSDFIGPFSSGENPVGLFREKLAAVEADEQVAAVLLRINSPGGSVNAADLMHRDLLAFRARTHKPVIACLMGLATGGAYFLASAADQIWSDPTTVTGGIGVLLNLYNLRELMGQFNIIPQVIKAGPKTDLGTPARSLTQEERDILETMAKEYHEYLQQEIRKARPGIDPGNGTTFDGRVFTASQALARKLIDRIGFLDDALESVRQVGNCPQATLVIYHRGNDPARTIYAQTPNVPLQGTPLLPSVPGLDRSRLPAFLSLWQPELTIERLGGK